MVTNIQHNQIGYSSPWFRCF